jgi:hypothetical protein
LKDLNENYEDIVTSFNDDVLEKAKDIPKDFNSIKEEEVRIIKISILNFLENDFMKQNISF